MFEARGLANIVRLPFKKATGKAYNHAKARRGYVGYNKHSFQIRKDEVSETNLCY